MLVLMYCSLSFDCVFNYHYLSSNFFFAQHTIIALLIIIVKTLNCIIIFGYKKSGRMRRAEHVARMEERRGVHGVLVGNLREGDHWGDQDLDRRIILRWIFRKWEGVVGTGWSWLRIGTVGEHL